MGAVHVVGDDVAQHPVAQLGQRVGPAERLEACGVAVHEGVDRQRVDPGARADDHVGDGATSRHGCTHRVPGGDRALLGGDDRQLPRPRAGAVPR